MTEHPWKDLKDLMRHVSPSEQIDSAISRVARGPRAEDAHTAGGRSARRMSEGHWSLATSYARGATMAVRTRTRQPQEPRRHVVEPRQLQERRQPQKPRQQHAIES